VSILSLRTLTKPLLMKNALTIFQTIVTMPIFPNDNLERIKQQMITGLNRQLEQPDAQAARAFASAAYGNHPYVNNALVTSQTINAITDQDIKNFYEQYYNNKNVFIAIVGNVSLSQAKKISAKLAASLTSGKPAPAIPALKKNTVFKKNIVFNTAQTSIILGETGIARNNPDYFSLLVGNYILGGDGLNSVLFSTIREEMGLTYSISSTFNTYANGGVFYIALNTRNSQKQKALMATQKVFTEFYKNGPTEKQVTAAKNYLVNSFPLTFSNNIDVINALIDIGAYHLPTNYFDHYRDTIQQVSVDSIKQAFQKNLSMSRLITVTAGNAS